MCFPSKFAFISDEVSQEIEDIIRFAKEFDLPGIELRSLNGRAFKDLTKQDLSDLSSRLEGEGLKVIGCSTPVYKCAIGDSAAINEHREIFKRSLEIAAELDCDLLRVFTFLRDEAPFDQSRAEQVAEHLLDLEEIAGSNTLRIGIENEHSCAVATALEMKKLLSLLPEGFGAIWDPCNVLYLPDAPPPSPEDIPELAPRLFHMHVKDAVRKKHNEDGLPAEGVPVGIGEVDWRGHFEALRASNYNGLYSLETHWRFKSLDEELLHLPSGYGFSEGGEAASRICMHLLKVICAMSA
jgi:sugar phosphate isomerase/epimerase